MTERTSSRRTFLAQGFGGLLAGLGGLPARSALAQYDRRRGGQRSASIPPPQSNWTPDSYRKETDPNAFSFSRVRFAPASHRGRWDDHPASDEALLEFAVRAVMLNRTTRAWRERVVDLGNPEQVYSSPFLFMNGETEFFLTPQQALTLGEFFKRGGFLYGDECSGGMGRGPYLFYQAFQREIPKAFPGTRMQPVPVDHLIYRCFFEMRGPAPKPTRHMVPDMGLFYEDRLAAFVTPSDVHCGWAVEVYRQDREACLKMGTNIIIYALTH